MVRCADDTAECCMVVVVSPAAAAADPAAAEAELRAEMPAGIGSMASARESAVLTLHVGR